MKFDSKQVLRSFPPQQIVHQIFLILVLFVVLPIIVLGLLLIHTSQKAIKTSVLRDHKELAVHITGEVNKYVEGPQQALNVTAAILGTLQEDAWRAETSIVELALRYPDFERISVVDIKGKEIASSQLGTELRNRSTEEAFLKSLRGEGYVSEVKISEDYFPLLTFSTPIRELGRIKSVLIAELNLRGAWDLVDNIKIGKAGRAFLIDHEGRLLSHPDKKLVLKMENPISQNVIHDVLRGNAGSLEEVDANGGHWLVSYAPIDNMKWGLVTALSTKEAYAFSEIMKAQSWVLIFLSILATVLIGSLLSRFMSRPVEQLVEATEHIAQGEFTYRLHTDRRDEMGRLFKSFNSMTEKLKSARQLEKLSTIGRAATAIAHELKNSLVLINTYIGLLPKRHKEKDFVEDFSQTVPRELDSWKKMLQNMMDYSKFLQFQMSEVDINSLISEVAGLAYERASQNQVDFVVHADKDLPAINGNADRLKQVLLNLVNNALQATPPGGSITLSTDFHDASELFPVPSIRIQVDDTGEGIHHSRLNRVFEPFYTTKDDGLGLGLAMSKEIIDYHGGCIEASNRHDHGARFLITIPIAKMKFSKIKKVEKSQFEGI